MIKAINLFLGLLLVLLTNMAIAQEGGEYEYVESKKDYLGLWEEGSYRSFDTPENAVAQALKVWCQYRTKCSVKITGAEYYADYNVLWALPVTFSGASAESPDRMFSESMSLQVWHKCPYQTGWTAWYYRNLNVTRCYRPLPVLSECDPCNAGQNEPVPSAGNPIILYGKIKRQTDVDYMNKVGTLKFIRTYQSDTGKWTHNFENYAIDYAKIDPQKKPVGDCFLDVYVMPTHCFPYIENPAVNRLVLVRGNGRRVRFGSSNNYLPSSDVNDRATPVLDSGSNVIRWKITNTARQSIEEYTVDGRLHSITAQGGQVTLLHYSTAETPKDIAPQPGLLIKVVDSFGAELNFRYNALGQMVTMLDPEKQLFSYAYDDFGNLTSVTYPGGKVKTYLYNEAGNIEYSSGLRYLTGIIDENNVRFATYKYLHGEAFSTERAGGVERYEVSDPYEYQRVVKDPLGTTQTYNYQQVGSSKTWRSSGVRKLSNTGSGDVVSSSIGYDDQGNVSSKIDFDGTRTQFTYDLTRNLETKRVEAIDTQYARTITTEWHPIFRLPAKIIEPLKVTKFKYDTTGNLLEKSVQATLDKTGAQGAAAAVTGKIKTWKYTYNTVGQMLTSTDPDTALTKFTYDSKGNLETVENALKQVTKYGSYDAHSRVGRIEDPNGLVQELTYTPRGWLETRTVKGRQWRYAYDGVGQLKQVDSPDGTFVSYTYDDAHRLVKVADSFGNSITYTLDAMGNRKAEEVKDSTNTLVRKVSRTYDTLNQLKQQTGGAL